MAPRKLLSLDSLNLRVELGLKHFAAEYLGFVQLEVMANQFFWMVTACISRIMKKHQRHQDSFKDASLTFHVQFCINLLEQFLSMKLYGHVPEACRGAEKRTV